MVFTSMGTTAFAAGGKTNVSFTVDKTTAAVGDTISVTISNGSMTVESFTCGFFFDLTKLECTSISGPNSSKPNKFYINDEDGFPWVATATSSTEDSNKAGTVGIAFAGTADVKYQKGVLLTATFRVKAAGDAAFTLYEDTGGTDRFKSDSIETKTVTITKAPITSVSASVETPVAGQPLDFGGTVDASAPYSITKVEWFEGTNASGTSVTAPATAKAEQQYYARITLKAATGESFAESLNGTISGDYAVTRNSETELLLTHSFPATGKLPAASVTAAPVAKTGLEYNGSEQGLLGFVGTASGGTMQYSLDNATWSTAIPKGTDAKTYTVYYMVKGDSDHSDYTPSDNTVSVKIDPKDISSATIGAIADQSYTGSAITPDPEVKDGTATLTKGTDYTVSCIKNTYVGTNTAKLTITGKGNYTGTKDAYFTINAIDQTPTFDSPASLVTGGHRLDLRSLVNGAKGQMSFTISGVTSTCAALESDGYTLTSTVYPGTVNINVSITTKDENNDGTSEYNAFSKDNAITVNVINKTPDTTTMKVSQGNITYGETVSPAVTNQPDGTGAVSYTYVGRDGTTYSSSPTAPKNVGKYKVKATCESSTTIYTAEDDFEILPKSISGMTVTLDKTSLEYNGSAQTVNVTSVGSLTAADYTVTSGNSGTDVGSYTVTVTGKGNYKDTAKATWEITPATLTVIPVANQSKKFKEADPALTYNCSGNVSGQTPAFNGKLDREAGENAGSYKILQGDLALKDNGAFKVANYTLKMVSPAVKFEITKADAPVLKDITVSQNYTVTTGEKAIGAAGMPADAGTLTYTKGAEGKTGSVTIDSWNVDATGKVTYKLSNGAAGDTVTLPVVIKSTNYADTTVNVVITLTKPSYSGGGVTTYPITVKSAKNGDVTASHKSAAKGTTVTLTVAPDKGYVLDTLTVLDGKDKEIKLTEKNGKYTFTMPASKVTVEAMFKAAGNNPFTDVPAGSYYEDAVIWAVDKGITTGTSATTFNPNGICTRAQAVTFLWRAAGSPAAKSSAMPFADVKAGSYYYDAVLWAVEQGITKGTSETMFSPGATCTRAQIVTFLWRANGSPAVSGNSAFTDVAADAYYAAAVTWAEKNGVTGGIGGGLFGSNNNCTRAQIVTFIYRSVK